MYFGVLTMTDTKQDSSSFIAAPLKIQFAIPKRKSMERAIVWGLISVFLSVFFLERDTCFGNSNMLSDVREQKKRIVQRNDNKIALVIGKSNVKEAAAGKEQLKDIADEVKAVKEKVDKDKKAGPKEIPKGLGEEQQNMVVLTTDQIDSKAFELHGMLTREIVRQALLISSRDGLGLQTRDASLRGEVRLVENPMSFPLQLITHITKKREVHIDVNHPFKSKPTFRWVSKNFTLPKEFAFETLIEQTEELSRTEFIEVLKSSGYVGSAQKWIEKSTIPEKTLKQLNEWNFISQYTVVQDMHAAIRKEGESPERLAVLTRAYANLGSLTECLWSPAHKVFMARALLYAERLTARTKDSAWALAHRVYARTFAGRHQSALVDIKAIRSVTEEKAGQRPLPVWLNLLDAYCSYKPKILEKAVEKEETKHLAVYLRTLQTDPIENEFEMLSRIAQLLALETACCRAVDQLCEVRSLGIQRSTTEGRQAQLWEPLYQKLLAGNLPDSIKGPIKEEMNAGQKFRIKVTDLLKNSKPTEHEPSVNALGQLLQEVSFLHTYRKLDVLTTSLGMKADDMLPQVLPLLKGHPYAAYIESFTSNKNDAKAAYQKLLTTYNPLELEIISGKLITNSYRKLNIAAYYKLANESKANIDQIYQDQVQHKRYFVKEFPGNNKSLITVAKNLQQISPHMPQTVALNIQMNKDYAENKHEELIKVYGREPVVLSSLANRYIADKKEAKAEETLKLRIDIAPDYRTYTALANIYKNRGETDKWIETLKKALELPSLGLADNRVHYDLANHYMGQGEWKLAEPHAMKAAQSYSAWGLQCGAKCFEGLGELDQAEKMIEACSKRYDTTSADWYFWCVRNDHGDLDSAFQLVEQQVLANPDPRDLSQTMKIGVIHLTQGSKLDAFNAFLVGLQKHKDLYCGMHAALLADELGLKEKRDELLKNIAELSNKDYTTSELANYFQGMLLKQNPVEWNPKLFQSLLVRSPDGGATNNCYFAGIFLEKRGHETLATAYLQQAATSNFTNKFNCMLAAQYLRSQDKEIEARRTSELETNYDQARSRQKQINLLLKSGKQKEAIIIYDEILKSNPEMIDVLINRAAVHEGMHNYPAALADYNKALEIEPNYWLTHNNLAFLYAGCLGDEFRNGSLALKHAQKALDLLPTKYWINYSAMAAAYAEKGEFDKAIEMQKKARDDAPSSHKLKTIYRLKMYRDEKPYRRDGVKKESVNSIGMKFQRIPEGKFQMGASFQTKKNNEKPVHQVILTKPFEMGIYEVTQQQYEKVIGTNPSEFKGPKNPVESVSWNDAVEFCLKLSEMPDEKGFSYRLPTEAEWEYACRAGTTTKFSFGDDDSQLGDYGWYFKNSHSRTHPAGEKKPNSFGLYDMHGNVFEWCQDWFDVYQSGEITNPIQTQGRMKYRVIRGGGITNIASYCFSSARHNLAPDLSNSRLGFRVVRSSN